MSTLDEHISNLRTAAAEIRAEGHNGWGNACADAVDFLAALSQPDEARAPTPDQYRRAHLYLRQREADLGAGELDELLSIFGLVPAMSKEQP